MDSKLFDSLPSLEEIKAELKRLRSRAKLLHALQRAAEIKAADDSKKTEASK